MKYIVVLGDGMADYPLEELGGKWCPDLYYGFSILHRYIEKM